MASEVVFKDNGLKRVTPPVTPIDLFDLLRYYKEDLKSELNCVSLGVIRTFYPETQTADISISYFRFLAKNTEPDEVRSYPILVKCPVVIMNGGGSALTFPIVPGDKCVILFNDRDMDLWVTSGQINVPNTNRMHDLSDGIALVGIYTQPAVLQDYNQLGPQLNNNGTLIALEDKIRLETSVMTLLNALLQLTTAIKSIVTSGGQTLNPASITAVQNAENSLRSVLK